MEGKRFGKDFPALTTNDVKASSDSNGVCKAIKESGSVCKESQSLKIIDEIHQLYTDRLQRIDDEAGGDGIQLKIKTLQSWVNELGEQNAMLVRTVEQLEREAADRVALLEDSLRRSSRVALEYLTKLQDYDNQMNVVAGAKVDSQIMELKISSQLDHAKKNEEMLHERVKSLQNDLSSLLELVQRVRLTGNWDINGLTFKEVTPEDIFGSNHYQALPDEDDTLRKLQAEIKDLHNQRDKLKADCDQKDLSIGGMQVEIKKLQDDVVGKDSQIKGFIQRIQDLRDNITQKSDQASDLLELAARYNVNTLNESSDSVEARCFELEATTWKNTVREFQAELLRTRAELRQVENDAFQQHSEIMKLTRKLSESESLLQGALCERDKLAGQLSAKSDEVIALTLSLAESEKSAKDMREALTAEVAEKHDQLQALRRDVIKLEEQCCKADKQTHFKDDIIKELRKDVKLARSKMTLLEEVLERKGLSGDIGNRLLALNELSYSLPTKYSEKSASYEHQVSSLPCDSNVHSEKVAHMLSHQHATKFPYSNQCCIEKTHNPSDIYSSVEKAHRHSNPLRHSFSHEKITRTRTKSSRAHGHGQLSRVEEALKQELSKMNETTSCKPHHDVEVMESTMTTRTIAVQFPQQKQGLMMIDPNDLEAKERRILELERELKNVQKEMKKSWDELRLTSQMSFGGIRSTDHFSTLKEQIRLMMENLQQRDEKIARQNTMIQELESRLQEVRSDLTHVQARADGYLKQVISAQKNHEESQRRISELRDTLDLARKSMTGSLSKIRTSIKKKEVAKAIDSVEDYEHKAEECEATLTAMKGEIELLMHNLSSREKQIKTLEETISNLQSSLETAKGEMENAHHMALTYLKEKELVEGMQKNYEKSIADLKRALVACHEGKIEVQPPVVGEEVEISNILPDNVDKMNELLHQDQTTAKALSEATKDLLDALRHASKMEESKVSKDKPDLKKKATVSFAGKSSEEYEMQIRELQKQLKEAQSKILLQTSKGGSRPPLPPALVLAKEIEEYRVKTVEAQAALEDLKDAMDSLHQNLQTRENQVSDLEKMMTAVLDTLLCAQKDMRILQENDPYEMIKKGNEPIHNPDDHIPLRKLQHNIEAAAGEMYSPFSALNTSKELKPDVDEHWTCLQKSLNKALNEVNNICAKAEDYSKQTEEFERDRCDSEQKIEKLYLELESTQDDLKQTIIELQESVCRD